MKGRCRICHTEQSLYSNGKVRFHESKYTKSTCLGSNKMPIEGTAEEIIYSHTVETVPEDCLAGVVIAYIGGVATGALAYLFLF